MPDAAGGRLNTFWSCSLKKAQPDVAVEDTVYQVHLMHLRTEEVMLCSKIAPKHVIVITTFKARAVALVF